MGLVEAWESGIRRIISAAGEYGLPVPTVEVFDDMFRVNLYRNVQDNVNGGEKGGINGGDNFGDKARIREKAQKLTDIRKGNTRCIVIVYVPLVQSSLWSTHIIL